MSAAEQLPAEPSLFVTHHGFGGTYDLNIFAAVTIGEKLTGRPVKILAHDMIWRLKAGRLVEALGAVRASPDAARATLEAGDNVLVVPGGDHDAVKTWKERNTLGFHGHTGFVRLARRVGCPIVPVVTAGAGESLVVLSKGEKILERIQPNRDGEKPRVWPVVVSLPLGLTSGPISLLLPYLPAPTKLESRVLPAIRVASAPELSDEAHAAEDARIAHAIEAEMQATLTELTDGRIPLLGRPGRGRRRR